MSDLRAALIMDYQNVHLTAAGLFLPQEPRHLSLIHPLQYAKQVLSERNERQRDGASLATLRRVLVNRGLPSPDNDPRGYARNQAQKAHWEKDARVSAQYRPLKYYYERDGNGRIATDDRGRPIYREVREKGVDVMCALNLLTESLDHSIDVVILASQDTDLEPALDEALTAGQAKVETVSWYDPKSRRQSKEIRPANHRVWNTRMNRLRFEASIDRTDYT